MTAPAMASSSQPLPTLGSPTPIRPMTRTATSPAQAPLMM
jgi:hypothetical protein